ncbi:hypothetical protein [Sulfurimonas sp.]|jgi:hypothetical protein|uniref:hypothetical protein n=1 Tax=Sulfurimonas sp. TaxID=2022749 RepID=UPI0025E1DE19|nr:hypothetical protein [Sulfurimonas sp.]MBT5933885.1 hypothetical protein [Sulfurimonas sp.]
MLDSFKVNRQKYYTDIVQEIKSCSYRNKRYSLNFSIAIALVSGQINLNSFSGYKRKSDKFIVLEDHLACLILEGTDSDSAIRATSKLHNQFQLENFNKKIFIAVVTASDYTDDNAMIHSLFNLLVYAAENNMDNLVIDKDQIPGK